MKPKKALEIVLNYATKREWELNAVEANMYNLGDRSISCVNAHERREKYNEALAVLRKLVEEG